MRSVVFVLVLAACGSKKPPPPANTGSNPGSSVAGSGDQPADCPAHVDCMPPTDGPCPPPGLKERCPKTEITY